MHRIEIQFAIGSGRHKKLGNAQLPQDKAMLKDGFRLVHVPDQLSVGTFIKRADSSRARIIFRDKNGPGVTGKLGVGRPGTSKGDAGNESP